MEDRKESIKIRLSTVILVFIIFILLLVIAGIFVYYNIANKNDTDNTFENSILSENKDGKEEVIEEDEDIIKESKTEEIDVNSELVQKLYKLILKDNECIETIAYQNQKVTISNLENKAKLMTIFENMENSEATSTKTIKTDYEDMNQYYFSKEKVEEKAKQIFGNQVSITHETLPNLLARQIVFKNGEYLKVDINGGGGFLWEYSTEKLIKAEKKNDEIYLYDKYIHVVRDDDDYQKNTIYNASDRKKVLGTDISGMPIDINKVKGVNTFKHTFKKNTAGTYYWVSTEISE